MFRVRTLALCLFPVLLLIACDRPVDSAPPTVEVLVDPWGSRSADGAPGAALYASCASCHMADGSGRADGSIPRLAGQRAAVLVAKLERMHAGAVTLPVMTPFARALTAAEISLVAEHLANLPAADLETLSSDGPSTDEPAVLPVDGSAEAVAASGQGDYRIYCAGCHGLEGEGNDALLAPRLCGQHAAYLVRRMDESVENHRGDADPGMAAIVRGLAPAARQNIADWLATGQCFPREVP